MASPYGPNTDEIVFVHVDYEKGSFTRDQTVRAHTAHVNWQRYRQRTRSQRRRVSGHVARQEPISRELDTHVPLAPIGGFRGIIDYSQLASSSTALYAPARTLCPTFGALETVTFPQVPTQMTSRVAEHCLKVMWPESLYAEDIRAAWFQAFCKQPIIFHGFHCAAAVHADSLAGKITLSSDSEILKHKATTLHLLSELMSATEVDIVLVIHAILPLTHVETLDLSNKDDVVLSFSPHFPSAGWLRVYGNIVAFAAHVQALQLLIQRIGDLQAVDFPGLGSVLALCDLITASAEVRRPIYPCFWEDCSIQDMSSGLIQSAVDDNPARGFRSSLSDQVHKQFLNTFIELAEVDTEMARCRHRRLSEQDYRTLIFARNAAQHRLFCLQPHATEGSSNLWRRQTLKLGEICRLSAMLYANSVMFPLPPARAWRVRLLQPLLNLLNDIDIQNLRQSEWQTLAWSACIAALAAKDLECFEDLVKVLRMSLSTGQIMSRHDFQDVLARFLWTPEACNPALATIWDKLTRDANPI